MHLCHGLAHINSLCGWYIVGVFIRMQLSCFVYFHGWLRSARQCIFGCFWLVVNTCWLLRDGFFNSSELGGCLIYFNPISFTFIGCANNCFIKNLGVVYAIEKLCLSKVKACLTQVMIYIICNNHMCNLKILAQCIKCHKGFIAYYKANGIIAMKKHVKVTHKSFGFKNQYTCCVLEGGLPIKEGVC